MGPGAAGTCPLSDVPALEVGAGRQDDVGEPGLPFEPDGLVDHELHLALAIGPHVAIGLGHGADERAAVLVVHAHRGIAGRGVLVLLELRFDGRTAEALAPPLVMLVHHGLGNAQARDGLAFGGVLGVSGRSPVGPHAVGEAKGAGGARVVGDAALRIAGKPERGVARDSVGRRPYVAAGFAQALHGGQGDHGAGPFVAGGRATGAAPTPLAAGGKSGLLGAPLPGQRADLPGGDAALFLGPLGGLRTTVARTKDVVLPLVEADGMGGHVFLVVGTFGEPGEGDGQAQGHVGTQAGGEPLVAEQAGGVIEVGVDEDHLHAQFLQPEAARGALEGGVDASAGALRIGRPEDDHLGVLKPVFQQVVLIDDAEAVAVAPHVHATPVPALPAIRVVFRVGVAHQVHEAEIGTVAIAQVPPEVMRTGAREDGRRPLLALEADDLGGYGVQRFVPADGFVAGDPAVLDVAPTWTGRAGRAAGIEIHPLERGEDALRRVDGRPVSDGVGGQSGPPGGREGPSSRLDRPRRTIAVVQLERKDSNDPPILNVHVHRPTGGQIGQSSDSVHRFLLPACTYTLSPASYPSSRASRTVRTAIASPTD